MPAPLSAGKYFCGLLPAVSTILTPLWIVRRRYRRQESQIHSERLVGHAAAAGDFLTQLLRGALSQSGYDPEAPGVRNRRGELCKPNIMHASLNDRMANAEKLRDAGFQRLLRLGVVGIA